MDEMKEIDLSEMSQDEQLNALAALMKAKERLDAKLVVNFTRPAVADQDQSSDLDDDLDHEKAA